MKKLYFVRHGESVLNVAGLFAGTTDTALTPKGRRQAKRAGAQAKDLKIDLIISSPLSRAYDTAKIIAKEIGYPKAKIQLNPMLAERNYGSAEGQPYSVDFNVDGIKDAETVDELLLRAKEVVDSLSRLEAENVMLVGHGSIGRAIRHHLLEDYPYHLPERLANAEIVQWI